jgi:uncharacterized membrane protein HdeD (DUF308 family)
MSTTFPFFLSAAREELDSLRRYWGWFLALGIALIIVGMLAIVHPGAAGTAAVTVIGFCLLFAGGLEIASGVWARRWSGFFLHLLCGLLYLFVGAVFIDRPDRALDILTLLLAVFFVAGGLFRVVAAATHRFSGWGWSLVSGAISILLGLMIWKQFPSSSDWVIGTFVGIDLIFNGWSWVMLALGLRNVPATK